MSTKLPPITTLSYRDFELVGWLLAEAVIPTNPSVPSNPLWDVRRESAIHSLRLTTSGDAMRRGFCATSTDKLEIRVMEHDAETSLIIAGRVVGTDLDACRLFDFAEANRSRLILRFYDEIYLQILARLRHDMQHGVTTPIETLQQFASDLVAHSGVRLPDQTTGLDAARLRLATELVVGDELGLTTFGCFLDDDVLIASGACGLGRRLGNGFATPPPAAPAPSYSPEQQQQLEDLMEVAGMIAYERVLGQVGILLPHLPGDPIVSNRAAELIREHRHRIERVARAIPVGRPLLGRAFQTLLHV